MEYEDTRALNLLKSLININTVNAPGNEEELAIVIKKFAEQNNLYTEMKPVSEGRANIIVKLKGKNSYLPSLVFSGHLDTVPIGEKKYWDVEPFAGAIKNGKLYGRGACDMKGGVAAILEAMVTLKESGF